MKYGDIVKVPTGHHAVYLCDYSNGHMTTAGLYEEIVEDDGPVTYHSCAAAELPVDAYGKLWIDDEGTVQKIANVLFSVLRDDEDPDKPVFLMEDGHMSWSVTEVR